jgi:putative transcriptional regulator
MPEDSLMAYAAGAAPEALALAVATHLTLCPDCRALVQQMEDHGGAALGALEPVALADGALDAVFSAIDGGDDAPSSAPPLPEPAGELSLGAGYPAPLRRYIESAGDAWARVIPGVKQLELPVAWGGVPVRLTRLLGGMFVPNHGHSGQEFNVVLSGGFTDKNGHFERGDVAVHDSETHHNQRIDLGAPCVTLVVADGRMIPKDWFGRMLNRLSGGF